MPSNQCLPGGHPARPELLGLLLPEVAVPDRSALCGWHADPQAPAPVEPTRRLPSRRAVAQRKDVRYPVRLPARLASTSAAEPESEAPAPSPRSSLPPFPGSDGDRVQYQFLPAKRPSMPGEKRVAGPDEMPCTRPRIRLSPSFQGFVLISKYLPMRRSEA